MMDGFFCLRGKSFLPLSLPAFSSAFVHFYPPCALSPSSFSVGGCCVILENARLVGNGGDRQTAVSETFGWLP
jgi:hypothetical protein